MRGYLKKQQLRDKHSVLNDGKPDRTKETVTHKQFNVLEISVNRGRSIFIRNTERSLGRIKFRKKIWLEN